MLKEKLPGLPGPSKGATTSRENTIAFLINQVFDVRVLRDVPRHCCGSCVSWSGRCRKSVRGRIALDSPCESYQERVGVTAFRPCVEYQWEALEDQHAKRLILDVLTKIQQPISSTLLEHERIIQGKVRASIKSIMKEELGVDLA